MDLSQRKRIRCQNRLMSMIKEDLSDDKLNQLIETIDEMLVDL